MTIPVWLAFRHLFEAIYATEEDTSWIPGIPAEEKEESKIIQDKNEGDSENKNLNDIWDKGSFDSVEDSIEYHYRKHGKEVGATSLEQYLRKAQEFAKTAKKGSQKSYVNGKVDGVVRYKKNGKYIDIAPDGSIVSFGKQ